MGVVGPGNREISDVLLASRDARRSRRVSMPLQQDALTTFTTARAV
ncbi:hypothetical protein ACWGBH_23990 [Streptomyces massasporeus]